MRPDARALQPPLADRWARQHEMIPVSIIEPHPKKQPWPVLALGFRPFFLLAAIFAAAAVPLWLLVYLGVLTPASYFGPVVWHGHEMVFGFAGAVIAGFLLTAATNWTGRRTATAPWLAALALLWLMGRIVLFNGLGLPDVVIVGIDIAFFPLLAIVLAVPILATRNLRNMIFPGILLALGAINILVHLGALGALDWDPVTGLQVAIDLVLLMIVVLGGRVIPSFTKNALPNAAVRPSEKLSMLAVLGLACLAAADAASAPALSGTAAVVAGAVNALRMRGWGSLATRRHPILWILHVGYAWLVLGLILRGIANLTGIIPDDVGIHALTVGAIGSMVIGMMSRVSLGHTGRPIKAAPLTVAAYWLVTASAMLRILFSITPGEGFQAQALVAAGLLWSLAFVLFLIVYLPILARPRIDGRPG